MTEKTKNYLNLLKRREYRKLRAEVQALPECPHDKDSAVMQTKLFEQALKICKPTIYEYDDFGFHQCSNLSLGWGSGNVTPNYKWIITKGFDTVREEIEASIISTDDKDKKVYGQLMLRCIDLCVEYSDDFRETVKDKNQKLYNALLKVPHKPAATCYEACVFIKLCIYFLRLNY